MWKRAWKYLCALLLLSLAALCLRPISLPTRAEPPDKAAAQDNEELAQHVWSHRDDLFTFLRQPGLDATNWRAEFVIRFGVSLRKVWGGSRTWAGAQAQSVLMLVWRTPARAPAGKG